MKIKCPACAKLLNIPDSAAGKVVKCPCGKQLRVPGGSATPNAPAAAPRPAAPRPAAAAGPPGFDDDFFSELTDQDLQPIKSVSQPGRAAANPYAAPASVDGESPRGSMNQTLATPGSRILATLVDGLMFMVCIGIGLGIMFLVGMIMGDANEDTVSIIVMVVMGTCVLIPWIINVVLISKSGQTVGKKTLGIQMRNKETGQPAGFTDGFLMRSVVFGFVTNIPFVGFLVAIADIIMLFPEGHETIHDRIAKTIVTQV